MIYIGIDPDVEFNGIGIWDSIEKTLLPLKNDFWSTINLITKYYENNQIEIFLDAGWLNAKSNFHSRPGQSKYIGEKIAKNVGSNHQVGKLFEQFCQKNNIKYTLIKPASRKTDKHYFARLTGQKISNQDIIDACMLVYGR